MVSGSGGGCRGNLVRVVVIVVEIKVVVVVNVVAVCYFVFNSYIYHRHIPRIGLMFPLHVVEGDYMGLMTGRLFPYTACM